MRLLFFLSLPLTGCGEPEDFDFPEDEGEGLFAEGCPERDQAVARVIGVDATLPGDAVGTRGDLLLANERAAFVITEPDKGSTYYHYGGIIADAAPMNDCQPGLDLLDEVGLISGQLDLEDYTSSELRAFRGDSAEILADGSDGGAAVVRITGADDYYWLVEYELIRSSPGRPLSQPFGIEWTIDYILEPDSPILRIESTITNTGGGDLSLLSGALLSFAPEVRVSAYPSEELSVGGYTLDYGIPWLLATSDDGSLAYAVEEGSLGYLHVSGINAAVDVLQGLTEPISPALGGSETRAMMLAVASSDSASAALASVNPEPLPDQTYTLSQVMGQVLDADNLPVPGARVILEADGGAGWGALDEVKSNDFGMFDVPVPVFTAPWSFRISAQAPGRDGSEVVEVAPGQGGVTLPVSAEGRLAYILVDSEGDASPARLLLERSDGARFDQWLKGQGEIPLPPGSYTFTATRGYEYAPVYGSVEIPGGGQGVIGLTMHRVVDTGGFLSVDTHVHTSDSPDSDIRPEDQLLHAAAHGLEVVIHTEHEAIVDRRPVPAEYGLDAWVNNVIGEEVTASVPEHMTMFPAEPDGSVRGGPVVWYQKDISQLFSEMKERSDGGINLLNHPGYLDLIGWNRVTAAPELTDPTQIGLSPDASLWSWDLEGIEVMNGHSSPFSSGNRRFDNWQSMINAGHRVIAIGCSDDHGGGETGFPRTYFASSTDDPASFEVGDLVGSFRAGRALVSAGAFGRILVNGEAGMGDLVTDTDGSLDLDLSIEAIPEVDVTYLSIFANCDEVMTVAADDPDGISKFSGVLAVPFAGDTQLTVAAFGENTLPAGLPQYDPAEVPRLITNPVYIDGDGDGEFSAPGGRECSYTLSPP